MEFSTQEIVSKCIKTKLIDEDFILRTVYYFQCIPKHLIWEILRGICPSIKRTKINITNIKNYDYISSFDDVPPADLTRHSNTIWADFVNLKTLTRVVALDSHSINPNTCKLFMYNCYMMVDHEWLDTPIKFKRFTRPQNMCYWARGNMEFCFFPNYCEPINTPSNYIDHLSFMTNQTNQTNQKKRELEEVDIYPTYYFVPDFEFLEDILSKTVLRVISENINLEI